MHKYILFVGSCSLDLAIYIHIYSPFGIFLLNLKFDSHEILQDKVFFLLIRIKN
jgi:hypothetical protein